MYRRIDDNYPLGAARDPHAPYNQTDVMELQQGEVIIALQVSDLPSGEDWKKYADRVKKALAADRDLCVDKVDVIDTDLETYYAEI